MGKKGNQLSTDHKRGNSVLLCEQLIHLESGQIVNWEINPKRSTLYNPDDNFISKFSNISDDTINIRVHFMSTIHIVLFFYTISSMHCHLTSNSCIILFCVLCPNSEVSLCQRIGVGEECGCGSMLIQEWKRYGCAGLAV